jgi:peptide deformylase
MRTRNLALLLLLSSFLGLMLTGCDFFEDITSQEAEQLALRQSMKRKRYVQFNHAPENQVLYRTAKPITHFQSRRLHTLVQALKDSRNVFTVGLAANQIGAPYQVFLIEHKRAPLTPNALEEVPLQIFINPKIVKASAQSIEFWHSCMSAPKEKAGKVATYEWIEYEAFNDQGKPISGRLEGFAAVIFQHELRHLLKGLYLDFAHEFKTNLEISAQTLSGQLPIFAPAQAITPHLLGDYVIGESIDDYAKRSATHPKSHPG